MQNNCNYGKQKKIQVINFVMGKYFISDPCSHYSHTVLLIFYKSQQRKMILIFLESHFLLPSGIFNQQLKKLISFRLFIEKVLNCWRYLSLKLCNMYISLQILVWLANTCSFHWYCYPEKYTENLLLILQIMTAALLAGLQLLAFSAFFEWGFNS